MYRVINRTGKPYDTQIIDENGVIVSGVIAVMIYPFDAESVHIRGEMTISVGAVDMVIDGEIVGQCPSCGWRHKVDGVAARGDVNLPNNQSSRVSDGNSGQRQSQDGGTVERSLYRQATNFGNDTNSSISSYSGAIDGHYGKSGIFFPDTPQWDKPQDAFNPDERPVIKRSDNCSEIVGQD